MPTFLKNLFISAIQNPEILLVSLILRHPVPYEILKNISEEPLEKPIENVLYALLIFLCIITLFLGIFTWLSSFLEETRKIRN